jgi:hypothetical protein
VVPTSSFHTYVVAQIPPSHSHWLVGCDSAFVQTSDANVTGFEMSSDSCASPGQAYYHPKFNQASGRRIEVGQSVSLAFSLRFGEGWNTMPKGTSGSLELIRSELVAFGKAHPYRNIDLHGGSMAALMGSDTIEGASYLCKSSSAADCPNPRGWNFLGCHGMQCHYTRGYRKLPNQDAGHVLGCRRAMPQAGSQGQSNSTQIQVKRLQYYPRCTYSGVSVLIGIIYLLVRVRSVARSWPGRLRARSTATLPTRVALTCCLCWRRRWTRLQTSCCESLLSLQ